MAKTTTIAGNTFLFTGKLTEFTREDAEAHVEAEGGKVLSGVSAKLNYLVVGEDAGSKLAKAEALGSVTILHEKDFLKMMNSGKKAPNNTSTSVIIGDFEVNENEVKVSMENAAIELKKFGKDWIVPDLSQLTLMYQNKKLIKGYSKDFYWSKSSSGSGFGGVEKYWVINFNNGKEKEFFERVELLLRPIRLLKK